MKEYQVEIKETLVMNVTVPAESAEKAREVVEQQWKDSEHILDADHFQNVTFRTLSDRHRER